jgi:TolB-like protein
VIGNLKITAFPKFHDANDPHSFIVSSKASNPADEVHVGVFTDIGAPCEHVIKHFSQCHAAILESNYDEIMLEHGTYPLALKRRIRGGKGHLSNRQALQLFTDHRAACLSHLLLAHLSHHNNSPKVVQDLFDAHAGNTKIVVASRYRETEVFHIKPNGTNNLPVKSNARRFTHQLNLFSIATCPDEVKWRQLSDYTFYIRIGIFDPMFTLSKNLVVLYLLILLPLATSAQKAKSYTAVTAELSQKIVDAPAVRLPQNLAVVPFTATASSTQQSKAFGEYLTETILGSLSGHPQKLKLFERTRMDAILKEHEFILTDLMKPAAALKIGQLAPIDALLSGTYTKLKSYVDVSARIIDVSSGEITMSYVGRIKMNKNLSALFSQSTLPYSSNGIVNNSPPTQITINNSMNENVISKTKSPEELCKERVAEFRPRLNDLSSQEKINAVVTAAIATPFDNQCGKLHYDVMYSFTRFKLDPAEYKTFLLRTLDTIAYPAGDDRAYEIIRYITKDARVDESEWKSSFAALTRVGNYSISNYINYLIAKSTNDEVEQKARIASYFRVASEGKLGLPRPVTFEVAFVEMMEGLKSNQPLRQHVYESYVRPTGDG